MSVAIGINPIGELSIILYLMILADYQRIGEVLGDWPND